MRRPERPSLEVRRLRGLIRSFFADYLRIVESDAAALDEKRRALLRRYARTQESPAIPGV